MTASASKTDPALPPSAAADAALAVPVWDLPIRLFHWVLVALIAFSWWAAENDQFEWHFWSGYGVLFLLAFRILWGAFGSSTARFASFVRGPTGIAAYIRRPDEWRAVGHTPLGGLSVIGLLALLSFQVATGLVQSDEDGVLSAPLNRFVSFETAELAHDLHEGSFNILLSLIGLHVAAIIIYRFRGKRLLGAMIAGRSHDLPEGAQPMLPGGGGRLIAALLAALAVTAWIIAGAPPFGS